MGSNNNNAVFKIKRSQIIANPKNQQTQKSVNDRNDISTRGSNPVDGKTENTSYDLGSSKESGIKFKK